MPRHFDDHMIDDAIACIEATDLIPDGLKTGMIRRIRALRAATCATTPSCAACPTVLRCEDRIGAILNGDGDETLGSRRGMLLSVCDAA